MIDWDIEGPVHSMKWLQLSEHLSVDVLNILSVLAIFGHRIFVILVDVCIGQNETKYSKK